MDKFAVIVIGGGHAGIEAALASARMGSSTLMLTMNKDTIGLMSCNPAIGGVGKGQLVKEIDALGGQMGRAADACGIQFRILNASKGAAVQSSRAQIDMDMYNRYMKSLVSQQDDLTVKEAEVEKILVKGGRVLGIATDKEEIMADSVVLCSGTFLNGIIHVGLKHHSGGRINEPAAISLDDNLRALGLKILRFKTGTCPRLDKNTINYSSLKIQEGDDPARPFSFSTGEITRPQIPCYITYTNQRTHKIILDNLDKSPLYAGIIKSTGVRYCPSVEDKIVKFADKPRHQIFLEPQGLDSDLIYPNGLSTSLPEEVQLEILHSIAGLEEVKVARFGYGIEHSVVEPTQIYPTLEAKLIQNLFFAGQINGTTGYEEAAAQGLVAGINAALKVKGKEPFILDRSSGYIGVLIDDLTTKGTQEPYRMFTSRVEYRLILREDNADIRLSKIGYELGLVEEKDYRGTESKVKAVKEGISLLKSARLKPGPEVNKTLSRMHSSLIKKSVTLEEVLKRPEVTLKALLGAGFISAPMAENTLRQVEIEVKYSGFIERQIREVDRFRNIEKIKLPKGLDYTLVNGLSREIKEKLDKLRPLNLGQASRISGVTPAAISILMVYLKKVNYCCSN
ncbi:MAG: tRNA uridine-5-carboxymethylaminomethyl(34) synthesis enzyme MnmG [Candidatus Omnitrophica bacterium]|nr:tRNA uridine-5-carboxymethylaminomethyl(34) synthesis enzyme MnmG [Candidatus Omnitrophota bacterium]